jgi:predicted methyltransferase
MRGLLAGAAALLIGACAGGAVPGIMLRAEPAISATSPHIIAAVTDTRRPEADTARDALRHPADILAFAQVQAGQRIADIGPGGGYYTRLFAVAVGEQGRVFAIDRPNAPDRPPRAILAVAPLYPNVSVIQQGYQGWSTPEPLDAIFISQIYHDFHLQQLNIDVAALNQQMFAALKPGGMLLVIDHSAPDGALVGTDGATASHRIDQGQVVRELSAAGFVLEAESQVLRNPDDNRSLRVFEGDIRGHTDQFVLRFRKPG